MNNLKINAKTTKEDLCKYLGQKASEVKTLDADLYAELERVSNIYKNDSSKVLKTDLVKLVKSVEKCISKNNTTDSKKPEKKPTENSTKKTEKKLKKAENKVEDFTFMSEFELNGFKYEVASDIKNINELCDAYNNLQDGEEIVFAFYWTKKLLRQFEYFQGDFEAPKEFPLDYDLATSMYVSDTAKVVYAISDTTDACYMILPKDFEELDGIKYSGGVEFQIYRAKKVEKQ